MKECPAIIAALPREIRLLVRGWQEHRVANRVLAYTNGSAVVACAGMGAERATLAVQAAFSLMPVTALLSVGLAGACDPALGVGDIVHAGSVVDAQTGERYENSQFRQVLVSTHGIASVKEKQRLYAAYWATAVDMEAATVARLAKAHSIYFQATKSISDKADFEMEELARFATQDGNFREAAFAGYAALHPKLWKRVMVLGRNSNRAISALTATLQGQLDWYRKRG